MPNGEEKTLSMVQVNTIREYTERYLVFNTNMLIGKFLNNHVLLSTLEATAALDPENHRMPSDDEIRDIMVDVLTEALARK